MKLLLSICLVLTCGVLAAQGTFTSYFTGDTADVVTVPTGGIVLMGGASENDNAMRWFLERSGGGDIVVIRTSGSDGYNDYLFSELGVTVNSVQTIVMPTAGSALDPYIDYQIRHAEALWIAGGDQSKYVSYWKNKPIEAAIKYLIHEKKVTVGGTSAGMAILGGAYFGAANGTVLSEVALANPYDPKVSIGYGDFVDYPGFEHLITDTHFDNPDRRGRLFTFMARLAKDQGIAPKAIACEEYTSVCIDTQGVARVFGGSSDYAFFIQTDCNTENTPETCIPNTPLTWYKDGMAAKVYRVKGNNQGTNTFLVSDWKTGVGGAWQHWYAQDGVLSTPAGIAPDCVSSSMELILSPFNIQLFPNPCTDLIQLNTEASDLGTSLQVMDIFGKIHLETILNNPTTTLALTKLPPGYYLFTFKNEKGVLVRKIIK